mmetsp:Transcript_59548/g.153881  ORF Transcript_59548/g.153881 Transcript_59548/m.153881 type:complete len:235 (-) Transcript_59548:393-1097(-)
MEHAETDKADDHRLVHLPGPPRCRPEGGEVVLGVLAVVRVADPQLILFLQSQPHRRTCADRHAIECREAVGRPAPARVAWGDERPVRAGGEVDVQQLDTLQDGTCNACPHAFRHPDQCEPTTPPAVIPHILKEAVQLVPCDGAGGHHPVAPVLQLALEVGLAPVDVDDLPGCACFREALAVHLLAREALDPRPSVLEAPAQKVPQSLQRRGPLSDQRRVHGEQDSGIEEETAVA